MEEQFAQEKERLIAKLNKEHEQEIALLRQAHTAILSETKRKQWVSSCSVPASLTHSLQQFINNEN